MKYIVYYERVKKKGISAQEAIFYQIEDAIMWEEYLKKQDQFKDIRIEVH